MERRGNVFTTVRHRSARRALLNPFWCNTWYSCLCDSPCRESHPSRAFQRQPSVRYTSPVFRRRLVPLLLSPTRRLMPEDPSCRGQPPVRARVHAGAVVCCTSLIGSGTIAGSALVDAPAVKSVAPAMVLSSCCPRQPVSDFSPFAVCCCNPPGSGNVPMTLDCTHAGRVLSRSRPAVNGHSDWAVAVTAGCAAVSMVRLTGLCWARVSAGIAIGRNRPCTPPGLCDRPASHDGKVLHRPRPADSSSPDGPRTLGDNASFFSRS